MRTSPTEARGPEARSPGVLITGGSRGLGRALAIELARRGARLLLVARDAARLAETVAEIRTAGGNAHGFAADIGDKQSVHAIAAAAATSLGEVDVLVHNAGTLGPVPLRALIDTDCEDLERALAVNVVGPFRLTKLVAGPMLLRRRGVVAHVTSDAASNAYPDWGAYGASKATLDHLHRIWAAELGGEGVRFVAFDPGEMDTAMHRDALPDADPTALRRPADVAIELADEVLR
ncbi:MAG: SDR family oxidoreductase [Planctomycetes bacterium]|nr:SDR family oxidoreductase [Planctomycetota bacterium]